MYDRAGNIAPRASSRQRVLGGARAASCETQNDGDPIVLYDQLANRWFVSQVARSGLPDPALHPVACVSVTDDPTGEYYQYQFNLPDTYLNDYPKFGVWPRLLHDVQRLRRVRRRSRRSRSRWTAPDARRPPASMIEFNTGSEAASCPRTWMSLDPRRAGSPNYFVTYQVAPERLLIWQFHATVTTPSQQPSPARSRCGRALRDARSAATSATQCVPQLDSPELLETLSQATMFRLAYRNFVRHESLRHHQTVNAGDGVAGSLGRDRNPGARPSATASRSPPVISPGRVPSRRTPNHRWMGSIARTPTATWPSGYSISSSRCIPRIAHSTAGSRRSARTMAREHPSSEAAEPVEHLRTLRATDSSMSVDPIDDCTFLVHPGYYQVSGSFDWKHPRRIVQVSGLPGPGRASDLEAPVTIGTRSAPGRQRSRRASAAGPTNAAGGVLDHAARGTYEHDGVQSTATSRPRTGVGGH